MTRDLLREAARAARESSDERTPAAAATRSRVLGTLRRRRTRRLHLVRIVVPLAAILVASTTWAAATGKLRHAIARVLAPAAEIARAEPASAGITRAAVEATERAALERPTVAVEPVLVEPVPVEPAPAVPAATTRTRPSEPRPEGSTPTQTPSPPREDDPEIHALYTAAHHSHFSARDWPAALAGWDAYLRAAPRGRFAVEARYNRALCLARMNRTAEARAALEPFARGAAGGYRQAEAQALLDAMGPRP